MNAASKHFYRFHFLKSETWKNVRLARLLRDKTACTICGFASIHNDAHHVRYPDDIWKTSIEDLVTVCRSCHDLIHKIYGHDIPTNWRDVRHAILEQRGKKRCIVCRSDGATIALRKVIGGPTMNAMNIMRFMRSSGLIPRVCLACAPVMVNALESEHPSSIVKLVSISRRALNLTPE